MKKPLHLVIFFLAFQIEIRVKASNSTAIISEPAHCINVSAPCSFKVPGTPWTTQRGKTKLTAKPHTLLTELVQNKEWKLVEGALWVQNAPSVAIKTVSADVEASSGDYWVLTEKDRVVFRNISSRLIVTFKDGTHLEVPRGFQVWAGNVDSEARVQHGVVEPIELKEHLKLWYSVFPGSRKEFLSQVQDLKDQWVDLVEQSGEIYQRVAERKLASIEEKKRERDEAAKKKARRDAELRQKFYDKVFQQ